MNLDSAAKHADWPPVVTCCRHNIASIVQPKQTDNLGLVCTRTWWHKVQISVSSLTKGTCCNSRSIYICRIWSLLTNLQGRKSRHALLLKKNPRSMLHLRSTSFPRKPCRWRILTQRQIFLTEHLLSFCFRSSIASSFYRRKQRIALNVWQFGSMHGRFLLSWRIERACCLQIFAAIGHGMWLFSRHKPRSTPRLRSTSSNEKSGANRSWPSPNLTEDLYWVVVAMASASRASRWPGGNFLLSRLVWSNLWGATARHSTCQFCSPNRPKHTLHLKRDAPQSVRDRWMTQRQILLTEHLRSSLLSQRHMASMVWPEQAKTSALIAMGKASEVLFPRQDIAGYACLALHQVGRKHDETCGAEEQLFVGFQI